MSAIFGMFTHFLHAHMTIYRNSTPNITKGQKRVKKGQKGVKKGSKKGKKMLKIKNAHRNTVYECNFLYVYTIYKCAYDNLKEFDPKCNQDQKRVKKGPK